jgi:hypothetical protein
MLKGIISGAPEPTASLGAAGTTAASAPVISSRFVYVATVVGQTAVQLPPAAPGLWFFITTDGGNSVRLFTGVDDQLFVAAAAYDNTTPYVITTSKAVLVMTNGVDPIYYGVALG